MRSSASLLALALLGASPALHAQTGSKDPTQFIPRAEVAVGYQFAHTNAPPSGCQCFGLNGGFASLAVKYKYWLSFAGEVSGSHANGISSLGQNLTLTTFAAGPRVTFRGKRLVYFGQVLAGGAHASDSYFPSSSGAKPTATSFAFTSGGGVDFNLNHRLAIRPIEVQYLHTQFPNGVNDRENHLLIGAGLVVKFHGRYALPHVQAEPAPAPPPPPPPDPDPVPPAAPAPAEPPSSQAPTAPTESEFHENVPDALFDYNTAVLRPDALRSVATAAAWLSDHPQVRITIGGYADERGTAEYNLALAQQRADAAHDALVQAGIAPERLQVRSYGKGAQVCSARDEGCFQLNRRAAFQKMP